jgi:hypothetical protein
MQADPMDLLALVPLLVLLAYGLREAKREARRQPGPKSIPVERKTMMKVYDDEGEALPPCCPACEGTRGTPYEACALCAGTGVAHA